MYGNSFEPYLLAVVVPNEVNLITWAKNNGIDGDFATLVKDPKATQYVLGELTKTGKAAKVSLASLGLPTSLVPRERTSHVERSRYMF